MGQVLSNTFSSFFNLFRRKCSYPVCADFCAFGKNACLFHLCAEKNCKNPRIQFERQCKEHVSVLI